MKAVNFSLLSLIKKAQMLIGKPLHILQKKYDRFEIPTEIANLVGQKFTFIVRLQSKKNNKAGDFSFEIVYTKHHHGKDSDIHPSHGIQGHHTFAAQTSFQNKQKPLIPINSKETTRQVSLLLHIFIYVYIYTHTLITDFNYVTGQQNKSNSVQHRD
uniref:Uncharacterized protein n=1 Tax=Arundo donax TaxID=35708 RepID=A0A0A9DM48_ARUDO